MVASAVSENAIKLLPPTESKKPGEYIIGILLTVFIIAAVLHSIFGAWLIWVISGFVLMMWLGAIFNGGFFAKVFWSFALMFNAYFVWFESGCPGNAGFCAAIEAERAASEKAEAIKRAEESMESCALMSDWRNDPDCRIYTEREIADARVKHDVREAEESAKRDAEYREAEADRKAKLLKDLNTARKARGSAPQK
jgi:hypothetical protein